MDTTDTKAPPWIASKMDQPCASQHFGPWFIESKWMNEAVAAVRTGQWQPKSQTVDDDDDGGLRYEVHDGTAIISIAGQITKRPSSFGGASTIETRRALRTAADDRMVNSIMLVIDSPGGSVSGVADLANDVYRIDQEVKPVYAYCQDMACSAGYWIASQAREVYANETALVGCIGTYGVLVDTSEADAAMGFKYVLVSTGGVKGLGADGAVTDEMVADVQREINDLQSRFNAAVMRGRNWDESKMTSMADGRAHVGEQALSLGLIDSVVSLDDAMLNAKETTMSDNSMDQIRASKPEEQVAWVAEHLPQAQDHIKTDAYAEGCDHGHESGKKEAEEAMASKIDEAKVQATEEAVSLERERFAALVNKFGNDELPFVAEQYAAGHDLGKANEAYAALCKQRAEEATAELNASRDKLADVSSKNDAGDGVPAPVASGKQPEAENTDSIADPEERAKAEWEAMSGEDRESFISQDIYVAARKRELRAESRR